MEIVYGVEYIEVEFGERPEGWVLYRDLETCKTKTKEASIRGPYNGGYLGPRRPLVCVEIPYDSLEEDHKYFIDSVGSTLTDNNWTPKFKGQEIAII